MFKTPKYISLFLTLWLITHTISILIDGFNDEIGKAEVAVILGNTVNEDGSLSPRLKARLDKGLELYKDSVVK